VLGQQSAPGFGHPGDLRLGQRRARGHIGLRDEVVEVVEALEDGFA
jgi:hypothetical protein